MKVILALLSVLGVVAAQGVTEDIAPKGSYPDGCSKDYSGKMEVTVATVKEATKRSLMPQRRDACGSDGVLVMTLENGVLKDAKSRTGYIASNYQFQFDAPAQEGAIYTAGYCLMGNGSLALGPSTTFYRCASGSFWNLYDRSWAPHCEPVQIIAMACGDSSLGASQIGDGQVVATQMVTTTVVKPISDGQPQVITTVAPVPICQIGDGQVQGKTTPCASITSVVPKASAPPVSQYSDGQIQVTPPGSTYPAPPVTTSAPATSAPVTPAPPVSTGGSTAPPVGSNSTLSTVPKPSTSPSSSPSPSAPASSSAGRVEMASLAALVVGIVGAIAFL